MTTSSTSVRGEVTVNGEIGSATVTGVDGTGTAGVIGVGDEETIDVMTGAMGVIVGMGAVGPTSGWVTAMGFSKVVVSEAVSALETATAMGSAKVVVSEGVSTLATAVAVPAVVTVGGDAGVGVV